MSSALTKTVSAETCSLHRSVSFHLEKWPGGPDPREQEALQSMKTLLTAALLEFSLDQDGQR